MTRPGIEPTTILLYAQPKNSSRKLDAQNSLGFQERNGSSNLDQTTRPSDCQERKKREKLSNNRLCRCGLPRRQTEGKRKEMIFQERLVS